MFLARYKLKKQKYDSFYKIFIIKGFSLVEVLLGMAIFSIVILSIYSTFWSGIRIEQRSNAKSRIYYEAVISLEEIAKEIENSVSYDFSSFDEETKVLFGEDDIISFLYPSQEGIKVIQYFLEQEEKVFIHKIIVGQTFKRNVTVTEKYNEEYSLNALMRKEQPLMDFLQGLEKNVVQEIVCTGVKDQGLKFSYAYIESLDDSFQLVWKDYWKVNYRPAGIRIQLEFIDFENKKQPLIVNRHIYGVTGFWGEE